MAGLKEVPEHLQWSASPKRNFYFTPPYHLYLQESFETRTSLGGSVIYHLYVACSWGPAARNSLTMLYHRRKLLLLYAPHFLPQELTGLTDRYISIKQARS